MQTKLIVAVLLIVLGLWIVSGRAIYKTKKEVLRIGDLKAAVDEEHGLPAWTGWIAVAIGGVLLFDAGRRRGGT